MKRALISAVLALLVSMFAGPAGAAEQHTVRTLAFNYLPPTIEIQAGDSLQLQNLDFEPHTLTSMYFGMFGTDFSGVTFGQTEPVYDVETLPPGSYPFFCSFHPQYLTMRGTLVVKG